MDTLLKQGASTPIRKNEGLSANKNFKYVYLGVNDCALRLGADENAASDCELSEESLLEGDYNTKYTTLGREF